MSDIQHDDLSKILQTLMNEVKAISKKVDDNNNNVSNRLTIIESSITNIKVLLENQRRYNINKQKQENKRQQHNSYNNRFNQNYNNGINNSNHNSNSVPYLDSSNVVYSVDIPYANLPCDVTKNNEKMGIWNKDAEGASSLTDFFNKLLGGIDKKKEPEDEKIQIPEDYPEDNVKQIEDIGEIKTLTDLIDLGKRYESMVQKKIEIEKDIVKDLKNEKTALYKLDNKYYSVNLEKIVKLVQPLTDLNSMIGLDKIKTDLVDMILYYLQNFEMTNNNILHTVIEGPPGVGKTEIGKIIGKVYNALGIIPSTKFKIVKRTDLIGKYVGQTAHNVQNIIDEADGGVLFIDEAYSLGSRRTDDYSKECMDVLNQNLSENKRKFICIIAGYADELEECFFAQNPGLRRRFPFKYTIDGYSPSEMSMIFKKKIDDIKWKLDDSIDIEQFFKKEKDNFKFYGGDIDNFITACKYCHSRRVFGHAINLKKILTNTDINTGFKRYVSNKKEVKQDPIPNFYL